MWTPDIAGIDGPRYLAVASAIAQAIDSGELPPGTRLPPQRELAERLGVTVGTIGRAYTLAKKRRLVSGEVGRGTFVEGERPATQRVEFRPAPEEVRVIDLSCYRSPAEGIPELIAGGLTALGEHAALLPFHKYPPGAGYPTHRRAGAAWLSRVGLAAEPERVLVCGGAQQGLMVALAALAAPGETILCEAVTYAGLKALAGFYNLRLYGIEIDEHGLVPASLAAACQRSSAKILFLQSTLHNPTTATMPPGRREEIAAIARRHGLTIIEDDAASGALAKRPPPIAAIAPECTCYIVSLSKSLSPAFRLGYLVSPPALVERLENTLHTMTLGASPIVGELVTSLIVNNTANEIAARTLRETERRYAIAMEVLGGSGLRAHPASIHMWLRLPEPWNPNDFAATARRNAVAVVSSTNFAVDNVTVEPAVRVSLACGASHQVLRKGLALLAEILATRPQPLPAII